MNGNRKKAKVKSDDAPKLRTGEAKQAVIDLYSTGAYTMAQAFAKAGVSHGTHYNWLKADPQYAADVEAARETRVELLEDEAFRRAYIGTEKPVFYLGEECGKIREFSDVMMIVLLKAAKPAKYRERFIPQPGAGEESLADVMAEIQQRHGFQDQQPVAAEPNGEKPN